MTNNIMSTKMSLIKLLNNTISHTGNRETKKKDTKIYQQTCELMEYGLTGHKTASSSCSSCGCRSSLSDEREGEGTLIFSFIDQNQKHLPAIRGQVFNSISIKHTIKVVIIHY